MKKIWLVAISIFFLSCAERKKDELNNKELSIQIMEGEQQRETVEYKVRVFHHLTEPRVLQELSKKMQYHADSSFYREENGKREYAESVVPIPNGIKNCYEYIVAFTRHNKPDPGILNFSDQYITGKTYQLKLK